jgi:hypothetical protein
MCIYFYNSLYTKNKKNIPVAFGEVRQTINTPISMAKIVKRENAPTAVAVRCLDQQEYSLDKTLCIF